MIKTQLSKMFQLGGFLLLKLLFPTLKIWERIVKRKVSKIAKDVAKIAAKQFVNTEKDTLSKKFLVSGITLTNNEIKDIIKVINYLENAGILLKGTSGKLLIKKEDYLIIIQ